MLPQAWRSLSQLPLASLSLAGQEHGRTIPLADTEWRPLLRCTFMRYGGNQTHTYCPISPASSCSRMWQ
jgi:hypothetical protein